MQQALTVTLGLDSTRPSDSSSRGSSPRGSTQSIAVMPFVSLGPDQDIEYLCDGLAEELMLALGKLPGLRVVSKAASKSLQTATDIRSICKSRYGSEQPEYQSACQSIKGGARQFSRPNIQIREHIRQQGEEKQPNWKMDQRGMKWMPKGFAL